MAAPQIDTTTATVINLTRARRSKPAEPTPEEVSAAWSKVERVWEKYKQTVIRTLLADLSTWPRAFQRIREGERGFETFGSPSFHWNNFRDRRARGTQKGQPAPGDCSCGCSGFNDELAERLRFYRVAAAKVTGAIKPAVRQRRRDWLDHEKHELLRLLWWHGVKRIDRQQMREHLVESARVEYADLRMAIKNCVEGARESRARLRENRTHARAGVTDQPLTPGARVDFERRIVKLRELGAEHRARIAEFDAVLADPHALVRAETGCSRVAVA